MPRIALLALTSLLLLSACTGRRRPAAVVSGEEVPFQMAHNYFFRNDQPIPDSPRVTTQQDFSRLFGAAAMMGPDGMPTPIDFSRQFVLAIILPVTDCDTQITPLQVVAQGHTLYYYFQVDVGQQQSFQMQPLSLIILDRKYVEMDVSLINQQVM